MKSLFTFIFILMCSSLFAQSGEIKGTVKDAATNETIIGASVTYAAGKGTVTDINGVYSIKLDSGNYTITFSFIGYEPQTKIITIGKTPVVVDVSMILKTLDEVEIVADVAKTRETPIAFSNISIAQIQEELGTKDLPMILNTTPGAYATEQGGGSGDARVNVRGFDQRFVAVMVDGVPVNDMETGQVYWSNWDGLSDITRTVQIQRGLGASKLAIPSIGGTINTITQGIDQKMGASVKQEINDYGLFKTSAGFNSGQRKGGWGVTLAASRKWGNEWADGTFTDAYSYFFKVQKRFKKHLLSLSVNGAPQSHGQRSSSLPIAIYDRKLAQKLGINADSLYGVTNFTTPTQGARGLKYNPDWGMLNGKEMNANINFFHKPAFNLSHFWNPTDKINVSSIAYLSIGKGGGVALKTPGIGRDTTDGTLNIQSVYDGNATSTPNTYYSATEHSSTNYLRASMNNHLWYGVISSLDYKWNKNLNLLVGIDARYYKGTHYQTPYNLLGGDYMLDINSDANQQSFAVNPQARVKRIGDKTFYYNVGKVWWGGAFAQAEYKKNKFSTFITASVSETGYQRIDYFKKKDLILDGVLYSQSVGFGDVAYYNSSQILVAPYGSTPTTNGDTTFVGTKYIVNAKPFTNQSSQARDATTLKKWFLGYTFKGGANFNINDHHNVFLNAGYISMAPRMTAVFDNYNYEYHNVKNMLVYAAEAGYGIKYKKWNAMLNLYYTYWKNKPYSGSVSTADGTYSYNINGMNAVHKGIELNAEYKLSKILSAELITAITDWKTISAQQVSIVDDNNNVIQTIDFSAVNVHVGDAPQVQVGGALRWVIIKGLYVKPRYTYFAKHYANFNPTHLTGLNKDRESWKMPAYGLLDFYAGYEFKVWKLTLNVNAGISNLINTVYISDGPINAASDNFEAASTYVYMGMGRRFNVGLKVGF